MKGFIIDVPNALIIGKSESYSCVTAKSGSVDITGTSLDIKGGWSLYNLASIPTGSEINIELTDAKFDSAMLPFAIGAEKNDGEIEEIKFGTDYEIGASAEIVLPYAVKVGSVSIDGFTEVADSSALVEKTFVVTVEGNTSTIEFFTDAVGTTVTPIFAVAVTGGEKYTVKDVSLPKSGMVVLKYPIYSDDAIESDIVAIGQITIFKAAVTQKFAMGGSYKTASEFNISLKGLDAKRTDKKIFDIDFLPYIAE